MGEFAVVRQQNQAFGIFVQAPHVVEALLVFLHVLGEARAAHIIIHRGHNPRRLVERHREQIGFDRDWHSVHVDGVTFGIRPRSHFGYDGAIDGHPSLGNERFAGAPRAHPRVGQDLLQAFSHLISLSTSSSSVASGR